MRAWGWVAAVGLLFCGPEARVQAAGEHDERIGALIEALGSPTTAARENARRELVAAGPVAFVPLLDAAAGQNVIVAEAARELLTSLGPPAIDELSRLGRYDLDRPWRRREATAAVARMGPTVLPRMLQTFTTANPAGSTWSFAGGVLFRMKAVDSLIPLLKHPTRQVRHSAITMLANIADPRVHDALLEGLGSQDDWVRAESARGLGDLASRQATEPLLRALSDASWPVRQAAAAALGKRYEPRFFEPLATLARTDEEKNVRDTAANVLIYSSHDPVGVRLGRRYKPFSLSPADEMAILLRVALRMSLTAGLVLAVGILAPWVVVRDLIFERWTWLAFAAALTGAAGFYWGWAVEAIWRGVESLLLYVMIPLVAAGGYVPIFFLGRDLRRVAHWTWLTAVAGFYTGYLIGWLALWGYLGV